MSDKPDKSKIRPVLIVSNAISKSLDNDLLIIPVTSRIRGQLFEIVLTEDKLTTFLPALSAIRCTELHTIRNTRIIGRIAAVSSIVLKEIVDNVFQAISLPDEK